MSSKFCRCAYNHTFRLNAARAAALRSAALRSEKRPARRRRTLGRPLCGEPATGMIIAMMTSQRASGLRPIFVPSSSAHSRPPRRAVVVSRSPAPHPAYPDVARSTRVWQSLGDNPVHPLDGTPLPTTATQRRCRGERYGARWPRNPPPPEHRHTGRRWNFRLMEGLRRTTTWRRQQPRQVRGMSQLR